MPKIVYKGKEFQSLADMPAKMRHEYFKAKAGYDVSEDRPDDKTGGLPKGLEDMPVEVRKIYDHVLGNMDAKPITTRSVDELPKVEDLYRNSAPDVAQNISPDEVVYKPSPPIINPPQRIIESDYAFRRLLVAVGIAVLLVGIALAVYLNS